MRCITEEDRAAAESMLNDIIRVYVNKYLKREISILQLIILCDELDICHDYPHLTTYHLLINSPQHAPDL